MTDEERRFHRQDQRSLSNLKTAVWALALVVLIPGVGSLLYMGQQIERIDRTEKAADANTDAIRALEMSGARIGQRLEGIERSTSRVERMIEQLLQERRAE